MGRLLRRKILIAALAALAFALIGGTVGLALTSSGDESPSSVRRLALQPTDLPSDFVLAEEKLFSREDLTAELPADSQIAEQGLKSAVQLTYEPQEGAPVVDVVVYAYKDDDAAAAAHAFARKTDLDAIRPLDLGDGMHGYMMPVPDTFVPEGMGDDACLMYGSVEYDDGNEQTVGDGLQVQIYFMRRGSARAEVRVAGDRIDLEPEAVARNQYLRLGGPETVVAP
jgi:hypothetical protein